MQAKATTPCWFNSSDESNESPLELNHTKPLPTTDTNRNGTTIPHSARPGAGFRMSQVKSSREVSEDAKEIVATWFDNQDNSSEESIGDDPMTPLRAIPTIHRSGVHGKINLPKSSGPGQVDVTQFPLCGLIPDQGHNLRLSHNKPSPSPATCTNSTKRSLNGLTPSTVDSMRQAIMDDMRNASSRLITPSDVSGYFGESYCFHYGLPLYMTTHAPAACRPIWLHKNPFSGYQWIILAPKSFASWLRNEYDLEQSNPSELVVYILHWINEDQETGLSWDLALYSFEYIEDSGKGYIECEDSSSWDNYFSEDGPGAEISKVLAKINITKCVPNFDKLRDGDDADIWSNDHIPEYQKLDEIARDGLHLHHGDVVMMFEVKSSSNVNEAFILKLSDSQVRLLNYMERKMALLTVCGCPTVINRDGSWNKRKLLMAMMGNPLPQMKFPSFLKILSLELRYLPKRETTDICVSEI